MKETIQDLKNRRSVNKYRPEQIKDEELKTVLEAGMNAPSGGNKQSAVFVVVQDPELIKKMCVLNAKIAGAPEGWDVFYGAPTVISVLYNSNALTGVEDGSLCIGNMLNAAYAIGLGGRWIHRAKQMYETGLGEEILKRAGYEGSYVGVGNVILGYPEGAFPAPLEHKADYYRIIR